MNRTFGSKGLLSKRLGSDLYINSRTEKAVWRADIKETPARFVAEPSGCLIDLQEWRGMISPYSLCNVCLFSNAMMPYK